MNHKRSGNNKYQTVLSFKIFSFDFIMEQYLNEVMRQSFLCFSLVQFYCNKQLKTNICPAKKWKRLIYDGIGPGYHKSQQCEIWSIFLLQVRWLVFLQSETVDSMSSTYLCITDDEIFCVEDVIKCWNEKSFEIID